MKFTDFTISLKPNMTWLLNIVSVILMDHFENYKHFKGQKEWSLELYTYTLRDFVQKLYLSIVISKFFSDVFRFILGFPISDVLVLVNTRFLCDASV